MQTVGFLVLAVSVVMHAGWNVTLAWARRQERVVSSTADMLLAGGVVFLPIALAGWRFELRALPFAAASVVFSTIYFALLERAYARAPVGEVYPIVRGSSPVLVVSASAVLGATIGWTRWIGVALIAWGVLMIAISRARHSVSADGGSGGRRSVLWGLTIGACVATYTMFDSVGIQHASPMAYLVVVMGSSGIALKARDLYRRARSDTAPTLSAPATGRSHLLTVAGGSAMFGAFGLTLIAMTYLPIAVVGSVRESSIVIGALLGWVVLGERISTRGAFGIAGVLTGTIIIGLPA